LSQLREEESKLAFGGVIKLFKKLRITVAGNEGWRQIIKTLLRVAGYRLKTNKDGVRKQKE